jgi:hypothetical protein
MASLSDNPERWERHSKAFRKEHWQKTKRFREFTMHWRLAAKETAKVPPAYEIFVTRGEGADLRVVALVFYGKENHDDTQMEGAVEVDPNFRRQGLATAMYNWGEELSGIEFRPAAAHTNDAEAFWQARKRRS